MRRKSGTSCYSNLKKLSWTSRYMVTIFKTHGRLQSLLLKLVGSYIWFLLHASFRRWLFSRWSSLNISTDNLTCSSFLWSFNVWIIIQNIKKYRTTNVEIQTLTEMKLYYNSNPVTSFSHSFLIYHIFLFIAISALSLDLQNLNYKTINKITQECLIAEKSKVGSQTFCNQNIFL